METDLEKLRLVEYKIEKVSKEFANELKHLTEEKGFNANDMYWDKQMDKLAKRYAKVLAPLQSEYDRLQKIVSDKHKIDI